MDEVTDPSLSVLAEGDNGYLNYEYSEFLNSEGDFVEFDSYLIASDSSSFDDTTFLSSNGTSQIMPITGRLISVLRTNEHVIQLPRSIMKIILAGYDRTRLLRM